MLVHISAARDASDDKLRLQRYNAAVEAAPGARVGAYYTTFQQPSAQMMQNISALLGHAAWSLENVLRSNGSLQYADVIWKYQSSAGAPPFNDSRTYGMQFFDDEPQLGYYCIYRA
jgi:hypothetical protein